MSHGCKLVAVSTNVEPGGKRVSKLSDLEVLVIERACERLINEFFEAIDVRNDAHLHTLFTEDATYARPIDPETVISGRDTIVKMFD